MPTVSIVIPAYNAEAFIQEALDSVFRQTYRDFEVIVVDDGSEDRTAEIIKQYGHDVHYIHQKNQDVAAARNTGIRASRGEWIAFLDHDDIWLPEKLEKQVSAFQSSDDVDVVFCDMVRWYGGDNVRHESWRRRYNRRAVRRGMVKSLLLRCSFQPSTVMASKTCFQDGGFFDESLRVSSDWDMWLRLACRDHRFHYIDEVLCYYRDHGGNTYRDPEKMENDRLRVLDKAFRDCHLPPAYRKRAYARAIIESGLQYYGIRAYAEAYIRFRKAWFLHPFSFTAKVYKRLIQSYVRKSG